MRCMTSGCSGIFACSLLTVLAVANPCWPLSWWHGSPTSWCRRKPISCFFNSHMQPAYRELACQAPCPWSCWMGQTIFTKELALEPGTLVVMEDMLATHAHLVSTWFMSHHYDTSIIQLVQNIFDKDPSQGTISLNATYIILFNNPGTCLRPPTWATRVPWWQWRSDSCLPNRMPQWCTPTAMWWLTTTK